MKALQKVSSTIFFSLLTVLFLLPSFTAEAQYVRSRHDSKVAQFAQKAATKMQNEICPVSGTNARANIGKWVYDEYQNHYEIDLSISWMGRTWAFGDQEKFYVSGLLTVSSDGRRSNFKQTYANSVVDAAQRNTNIAVGAVIVGALLAADSQN